VGGLTAPPLRGLWMGLLRLLVLIIRFDDVLYELMPHDITLIKVHEANAFHVAKNVAHFDQPRNPIGRKIHLGNVTGDHGFGVKAEPRQEHLHLFGRCVSASSRITKESFNVRPRINANGAISMSPRSMARVARSISIMSNRAS